MKAKFFQKMLMEAPNAIEGTIMGMLDNTSRAVEGPFPHRFLEMRTAIGKLAKTFSIVAVVATTYDKIRLCQYPCQIPLPAIAWFNVPLETALNTGKTMNREGMSAKKKNTKIVTEFLSLPTLKPLNFLSVAGQTFFTGIFNLGPSNLIPK